MQAAQKPAGQAPEMELDPKYDHYDYPTTSPDVQSGHPGHTTKQQDAQVFQLRTQLEKAGYTERLDTLSMVCSARVQAKISTYLNTGVQLRFLRARKFNVELAKQMYVHW